MSASTAIFGDGSVPSANFVSIGDFNVDGRPDLLLNGHQQWLAREGGFEPATSNPPAPAAPGGGELAVDLDGDGAVDVVQVQPGGGLRLLWNNLAGGFTVRQHATGLAKITDLDAVDLDRDGRPELVAVNSSRIVLLRLATGRRYVDRSTGNVPLGLALEKLTFGDLDGDGDPDAVSQTGIVLHGNGTLRLVRATVTGLGSGSNGAYQGCATAGGPLVADLDGDRRLDVVVGREVFLRRGTGYASAGAIPGRLGTWPLGLVDCDRDGDADFVLGGLDMLAGPTCAYFPNDGRGKFALNARVEIPNGGLNAYYATAADLDLDGSMDLAIVDTDPSAQLVIARQRHAGKFELVASRRWPTTDIDAITGVADMNGDGSLDVLAFKNLLLLNDGVGNFTDRNVGFELAAGSIGDFDGDGIPDLVEATRTGTPRFRVRPNDGQGKFPLSRAWPWVTGLLDRGTVFDADGDGDLDLVQLVFASGPVLWRNDRGRKLVAAPLAIPIRGRFRQATTADFDGDGAADLVLGSGAGMHLLRNNGRGQFSAAVGAFPQLASTEQFSIADVDRDGDLDLIEAGFFLHPVRVWIQHAPLKFRNEGATRLGQRRAGNALVADVDVDGDPDLWIGTSLWLNDGTGVFANTTAARVHEAATVQVRITVFDADGDGDPDSVIGRDSRLWLETNRHNHFATRTMAVAGRDLIFRYHADPGYATGSRIAIPMIAARRGHAVVPGIGSLQLDHRSLVLLPAVVMPNSRYALDQRIQTPPGIYGDLWTQPLYLDPTGRPSLGNAARLRF